MDEAQTIKISTTNERASEEPVRRLHMVRVDGIEHFYWELAPALDLLAIEPEADFELVTVH